MAPIAILFGILLTLLGGGFFAYTGFDWAKATALIPAGFGLTLVVLGVIARNEKARMHAMHGAVLVGLIGFAMPTFMVVKAVMGEPGFGTPQLEQSIMAGLCLIFVGMCVKSFIDIRAARKQKEAQSAPPA